MFAAAGDCTAGQTNSRASRSQLRSLDLKGNREAAMPACSLAITATA